MKLLLINYIRQVLLSIVFRLQNWPFQKSLFSNNFNLHSCIQNQIDWIAVYVLHCLSFQPSDFSNMSTEAWMNLSSPLDSSGKFDRCRIFDVDFTNITSRPAEDSPTVACSAWDFDQELFKVTFLESNYIFYCRPRLKW